MVITSGQCQCNIESKTCARNSNSFSCIEMYSIKYDKQALSILHLGDGRQCMWWLHGSVAWGAMPCGVNTGATWCLWLGWQNFWDCIFNRAGRSCCKLIIDNWMPHSTMEKSCPVTCCRTWMLWVTKMIPSSFVGQQLHTLQSATRCGIHDSIQCDQGLDSI